MIPRPLKVAVLVASARYWDRQILLGVLRYANSHGEWEVYSNERLGLSPLQFKKDEQFDGVIVQSNSPSPWSSSTPTVYFGFPPVTPFGPSVTVDNEAITRLAVEHLGSIDFPNAAFIGIDGILWSQDRQNLFVAAQLRQRRPVTVINVPKQMPGRSQHRLNIPFLVERLRGLPLPSVVFVCYDELAAHVIMAARQAGIRVPEDLAILGVDDDDVWCVSVTPSLSTVAVPNDCVGFEAARLLDQIIGGKVVPPDLMLKIGPTGLVQRGSTDVVGYSHPIVNDAIHYIRTNAPRQALTVDQIAQALHVSRQYLARCFQANIGHSIKFEVDRIRGEMVRANLQATDVSIKGLSQQMGFSDISQFSRFCRRVLGLSPTAIRRK